MVEFTEADLQEYFGLDNAQDMTAIFNKSFQEDSLTKFVKDFKKNIGRYVKIEKTIEGKLEVEELFVSEGKISTVEVQSNIDKIERQISSFSIMADYFDENNNKRKAKFYRKMIDENLERITELKKLLPV